mgnify:CR=1 FL=1
MTNKITISSSLTCVSALAQYFGNKNNRPSQFDEKSGEIQESPKKLSESHEKRRK